MSQKIQVKFYPLTSTITTMLRKAKLTAAEWRIWSYLIEIDPWGDRYQDLDSLDVMSKCNCSRATFYRAIAKFQKLGLFDIQDKGFSFRNLTGASKLMSADPKIGDKSSKKSNLKNEIGVSKMRRDSQICENQSPKSPPDKASNSPQTLQIYSDFIRSLSKNERENFFEFVREEIKHLEKPINDLEAWLASKTKAQQNRWEVYFQNYRKHSSKKQISKVEEISAAEKKSAIARWQEHLKQQKLAAEKAREKSNRPEKSQTKQVTDQNSSNHNQATSERPENSLPPTPETPDPWRSEIDQILNNPQGCTKNTSPSSPPPQPDQSQNRKINKHQARDILFTLDLRQRLENSQNQDLGGES